MTGQRAAHRSGQAKTCQRCGAVFPRNAQDSTPGWRGRRFCSITCSNAARSHAAGRRPRPVSEARMWDMSWMDRAHCRDAGDDFVPEHRAYAGPALRWCGGCAVRERCLAFGVATGAYGVWGGEYLAHGKVSVS